METEEIMRKKVIFIGVVVVVIVALLFVIPNPFCYREKGNVNGIEKDYYTIFTSLKLQNDLNEFDVKKENLHDIYGENTPIFGESHCLVVNGKEYSFRRFKDDVIVIISDKENGESNQYYSILSEKEYIDLSKKYEWIEYDDVMIW